MNQNTHVKKSKRNTARSSAPVRQTPGGRIGSNLSPASSSDERGPKPPAFSYPDEPQAFPINMPKSVSFRTDSTSHAEKKDIHLFTPASPKKAPRISSSYTTLSETAFQPTDENEAYAREITLRRREERRQAELEKKRLAEERQKAEADKRRRAQEQERRAAELRRREEEISRREQMTPHAGLLPQAPDAIPAYLKDPGPPHAFHEIPVPAPRKKKHKKKTPEPQLSDYQPLLDYKDDTVKPEATAASTIRIPAKVQTQKETLTDLQDVIPVKEGTGDTRPNAIKKERESRRKRDERLTYLLVIFVIIFAVSGFFLFRIFWSYKKAASEYTSLAKDYVEMPEDADQPADSAYAAVPYPQLKINFASLFALNKDMIGWIYVPGCDISYPLVKGEDNEYYLSHTFENNPSSNGAIFMDYQDKSDFSSFNTFIYGHDMRDGSMFASLFKYGTNADLIGSYPYFYIYLMNGNVLKYHICSFYTGDGNSDSFLRVDTAEQKASYVAMILAKSTMIKTEQAADAHLATADDTFVTLSTCHGTEQRFLVHGYLEAIYNTITNSVTELY